MARIVSKSEDISTKGLVDVSLDVVRKKRFRIDGDNNRILELNTSDLGILARLKEAYPKLVDMANNTFKDFPEIANTSENYDFMTDEPTKQAIETLQKADEDMRALMDYIFDANVSEVCAPSGSMYDPINGGFRFEHIIGILTNLYETDISSEMGKLSKRVQKHTSKYTG